MHVEGMTINRTRQRGYATLAVVLLVLTATTLIVLYGAQAAVLKQRMLGNEVQGISAFTQAEQGLDAAVMFLRRHGETLTAEAANDRWLLCSESDTELPCGDGQSNRFGAEFLRYRDPAAGGERYVSGLGGDSTAIYFVAACRDHDEAPGCDDSDSGAAGIQPAPDVFRPIRVIAAEGGQAAGRATLRQGVRLYMLLAAVPPAPLVTENLEIGGSVELVTNPNGGGRGVPVSVWSPETISTPGHILTCQPGEYETNGERCPSGARALTTPHREGGDIVETATDFPADLFAYLFGVPASEYRQIRQWAAARGRILANCTALDRHSEGLYWIQGDCGIRSNVGTASDPVLLVVSDGRLTIEGEVRFAGLLFAFTRPETTNPGSVIVKGDATVRGSIVSDRPFTRANGSLSVRYEGELLAKLRRERLRGFGRVPGSWADS